jgi:hypothetical protein
VAGGPGDVPVMISSLLIALQAGLLLAALVLAVRRADRFATALCVLGGVESLSAYWTATRVRGPLYDYLLVWVSVLGFLVWCGIGVSLLPAIGARMRRPVRSVAAFLLGVAGIVIIALATVAIARQPPLPAGRGDETVDALADTLKDFLRRNDVHGPIVSIATHESWRVATGIVLQLYKASVPLVVERDWVFMFGPQFAPDGGQRPRVLIGDREFGEEARRWPDRRFVAEKNGISVYAVVDPAYLARHLWRGRVRVVTSAPDGFITVEVPEAKVVGALVTADGMSAFRALGSRDGAVFAELGTLRKTEGRGMRQRALAWDLAARPRYLRIGPMAGEGEHSIGEIQFILADVAAPESSGPPG